MSQSPTRLNLKSAENKIHECPFNDELLYSIFQGVFLSFCITVSCLNCPALQVQVQYIFISALGILLLKSITINTLAQFFHNVILILQGHTYGQTQRERTRMGKASPLIQIHIVSLTNYKYKWIIATITCTKSAWFSRSCEVVEVGAQPLRGALGLNTLPDSTYSNIILVHNFEYWIFLTEAIEAAFSNRGI